MASELAYFLKINVAIILFYAFYRLFFYKDTFFQWRRIVLLCFFTISPLYPLLNMQEWVKDNKPMIAIADIYATTVLSEYTVETTPAETPINWHETILAFACYTYFAGVVLLLIRFLLQLGSIILLHLRCRKEILSGTPVHTLDNSAGPFSFFGWIFIHFPSHSPAELSEIITHEVIHARQYHSIDVIISELMCIFCWLNPFVWLMKREVRNNLEYMTDSKVLETGHDSKTYQYHLLGLAHHKAVANLSNSFNVLPLKNRIKMMNKKRTRKIGRTKYILFLPFAVLLMIASNIEAVARTTKELAKDVIEKVTEQTITEAATITQSTTSIDGLFKAYRISTKGRVIDEDGKPVKNAKGNIYTIYHNPQKNQTAMKTASKESIFDMVEEMPVFPGDMLSFISNNICYPAESALNNIQGRVIIQFIVNSDGNVSNAAVIHSVDPYLDKEALRVVSSMPKWAPGRQKGKIVPVRFTIPIQFKLNNSTPEQKVKPDTNSPIASTDEQKKNVSQSNTVFN